MESPRPRPPGRDWKNYYLFGCTVRSNFPFQIELPPADGEPDLTLRIDPELPTGVAKQAAHLYSSEAVTEEGLPWARLYRLEEGHLIKIATVADFVIGKESLTCRPRTEDLRTVEAFLLQVAMSFWLETIGHPVLHASCIAAGDGAAAFLAFSGTGKSTLAAAFLTNGYRLISDDSLPLEITDRGVLAWPCHPRIKMEPEQARLFLEEISHLPPVNDLSDKIGVPVRETWSGSFGTSPEKLLSCYLPEHRDTAAGSHRRAGQRGRSGHGTGPPLAGSSSRGRRGHAKKALPASHPCGQAGPGLSLDLSFRAGSSRGRA